MKKTTIRLSSAFRFCDNEWRVILDFALRSCRNSVAGVICIIAHRVVNTRLQKICSLVAETASP